MKIWPSDKCGLWVVSVCGIVCSFRATAAPVNQVQGVTAVFAKASDDYVRAKLPDGTFQAEYYSFGIGGKWGGALSDSTVDKLKFMDVAKVISLPLADQRYVPTKDPNNARLLIMVYWGTTVSTDHEYKIAKENAQIMMDEYRILLAEGSPEAGSVLDAATNQLGVADNQRDRLAFKNAAMLGYDATGLIGTDYGKHVGQTAIGISERDLTAEIESERYFVVLMAYDFRLLWKKKKHKLLWETRFSIDEHHNAFDIALPAMAHDASKFFGQDSHGLLRTRVLEGHVEIGGLKSLGEVDPQIADGDHEPAKPK